MDLPKISLVAFHQFPEAFIWPFGEIFQSGSDVNALHSIIANLSNQPGHTLFWDFEFGVPELSQVQSILSNKGDLWHGGLKSLGKTEFRLLKYIKPCWTLSIQNESQESSFSWKIDLKRAMIPNDVFLQLGNICEEFETIEAAALEFGYRCITQGVIPVYLPEMGPTKENSSGILFSAKDEFVFLRRHFRSFWVNWAALRSIVNKTFNKKVVLKNWKKSRRIGQTKALPYHRKMANTESFYIPKISVILITLGRYQYLNRVIEQLSSQRLKPFEILIVDATPSEKGKNNLAFIKSSSIIPIRYFPAEKTGQCSQRNFGIQKAEGDYIFFMDDDMEEVQPDHLELHWQNIIQFKADVSSGVPDEKGALVNDRKTRCLTISDVFPTNDSLVSLTALKRSGLFDERMDKGQSEDHELGIRLYKSGALMVLDPNIRSLHLRAPSGGLRIHGIRKITRSSARKKILHRRLPHITELYLQKKHFSPDEIRESLFIALWATFSFHGNILMKILKIFTSLLLLPDTYLKLKKKLTAADLMLKEGAVVPNLEIYRKSDANY